MSNTGFISEKVLKLYDELEKVVKEEGFTSSNIISIVIYLMQIVEGYNDLSGKEKKELVIEVLNKFIDENVDDEKEENELKFLVRITVPPLIDSIISLDKRELKIKTEKCLSKIFCCL